MIVTHSDWQLLTITCYNQWLSLQQSVCVTIINLMIHDCYIHNTYICPGDKVLAVKQNYTTNGLSWWWTWLTVYFYSGSPPHTIFLQTVLIISQYIWCILHGLGLPKITCYQHSLLWRNLSCSQPIVGKAQDCVRFSCLIT